MKKKNLYDHEDEVYNVTSYSNDYIVFASMTLDFWSDVQDWVFMWEISVYEITQSYNHPSAYAHEKPILHYSRYRYDNPAVAKHDMYNQIEEIKTMYESKELDKRSDMFVKIHSELLTDLREAGRLARTELDMICAFGLSNDRLILRYYALKNLDKALRQLGDS